MRTYGRRFAKRSVERDIKDRVENRDAILWDIDETTKTCRVKIQGSSQLIRAHYPRNWKSLPYWLKRGNAVRVLHRSGVRGYVEVVGEGRAIPTPVSGSGMPDAETLPDGFITGGELYATTPASMSLIATTGTYRIDGEVYSFSPESSGAIVMDDPAPMVMGSGNVMLGVLEYAVTLDAAPAVGYFRYDAFVIGTDGVVDYITGTESKTPSKPDITANHVLIGDYILVRGGVTSIETVDIGVEWNSPSASSLDIDIEGDGMAHTLSYSSGTGYEYADIEITVLDQYDNPLSGTYNGYLISLEMQTGLGEIYSAETGWSSDSVEQHCTTGYTFQYRIDKSVTVEDYEQGVVILVTLESETNLQTTGIIILDRTVSI